MRTLSFIFIMAFAAGVSAQSPMLVRSFDEGAGFASAGEFAKALKSYRTALLLAENEKISREYLAKLHYNLGVCLFRSGKAKDAVREFNTAIELRKKNYPRAYYALGMAQTQNENWPKARMAFQEALKIDGSDGESWFDLAFVYLAERDFDAAALAFRHSIRYKSVDTALSHNNVGVILAMKGEFSMAEKNLKRPCFYRQAG